MVDIDFIKNTQLACESQLFFCRFKGSASFSIMKFNAFLSDHCRRVNKRIINVSAIQTAMNWFR